MTLTDSPAPATDARTAAVAGLADQVAGTLRLAGALARGGRRLDLAGLDQMIGRLCAQALDLPPDQGRRLRPRLAALLADLDRLATDLTPED